MAGKKKPVRLFEFTATVSYSVVVAAISEADARDAISSWEQAWPNNSEFLCVDQVELTHVRDLGEQTLDWAEDEANTVSTKATERLEPEWKRGEG